MKKILIGLAFAALAAASWALPTTQQVEAEVKQGNYAQAESMMSEVVTARPGSAKAHYVYAEILAHNRNFAKAADEAQKARQIDPALSFADPEKFRSFEQLLAREQSRSTTTPSSRTTSNSVAPGTQASPRMAPAPVERSSGLPSWIWIAGAAVLGFVAWRAMSRRNAPAGMAMGGTGAAGMAPGNATAMGGAAPYGANPYANPNAPYGPGVPPGRPGGGLLGTGMAVAGGVAGGMLLDQMLHRHDGSSSAAPSSANNGGLEPGIFDTPQADAAGQQLVDRPVDFGQGNDWDAGGGSFDVGSADDGGGDWN